MDKVSRVNKYKNLRDSLNDGVAIEKNEEVNETEAVEEIVEEDEYSIPSLENVPETDEEVHFIDNKDDPGVKEAITRVRENSGKGVSYNTRMDILNQIQASALKTVGPSNEEAQVDAQPVKKGDIEKAVKEAEEPDSSEKFYHTMSELMQKNDLIPESQEDEIMIDTKESSHIEAWMAEESEEVEEVEEEPAEPKKRKKEKAKAVEGEEEQAEGSSLFEKILGFLVGVLLVCLLLLVVYIIRLFFFS